MFYVEQVALNRHAHHRKRQGTTGHRVKSNKKCLSRRHGPPINAVTDDSPPNEHAEKQHGFLPITRKQLLSTT